MWIEDPEDMSLDTEQDGIQVVKQLDKAVLSRGAWVTIAFLYEEWDPEANKFGPPKVTLRKFRRYHGGYKQEAKFNISTLQEAATLAHKLLDWAATAWHT